MDLRGFWREETENACFASTATPAKARGTQPIGVSIGSQSNPTDDMKTQPDQPWTDAADAMLTELRGRGLGNSEIAREMGRGRASIAHRCAKLIAAGKLPRRQSWRAWTTAEIRQAERLLRDGMSWKDVARRLNRTQDALYKIAQLHALQIPRGPYMPHERVTIKRMASQGRPARAIAATLGRPVRGVRDFMQRQKIRRAVQKSD